MQKFPRAQRNTLTFSQMYGGMSHAGMMEGKGIFSKIGKFFKKAVKKVGKFIKKKKVLSKGLSLASLLAGKVGGPKGKAAGLGLLIASQVAKQQGFGLPSKIKAISRTQIEAILKGLGTLTGSGGLSLARAKFLFPRIKGLSPTQMRALAAFRGRLQKGGGVSLAGGRATGLSMSGMGFSGMGIKLVGGRRVLRGGRRAPRRGQGIKLAGQGIKLAGQGLRLSGSGDLIIPRGLLLKKKVVRRRPQRVAVRRVLI